MQSQFPAGDSRTGWGERNDASDKDNTQCGTQTASGKAGYQTGSEANGETCGGKTRRKTSGQVGRSLGTGALQAVQAGLGGHRGSHAKRHGHTFCLPVLSEVAPCTWSGAGI